MPDGSDVAYVYDGSFEGWLTAVFDAYDMGQHPVQVAEEENLQIRFDTSVRLIVTDEPHAERVRTGLIRRLGSEVYEKIWLAFLSCLPNRGTELYEYVRLGFSLGTKGRTVVDHLTDEHVIAVDTMSRRVGREAHLLKGFVRFNEMEGGVYYAVITPDNHVLPVIMPHFVDRFGYTMPFIIHDKTRGIAGLYGGKSWYLTAAHDLTLPDLGADEAHYMALWKRFYDAIGIKERENPRCKRNLCPEKFWPNMLEMKPDIKTASVARGANSIRGANSVQVANAVCLDTASETRLSVTRQEK